MQGSDKHDEELDLPEDVIEEFGLAGGIPNEDVVKAFQNMSRAFENVGNIANAFSSLNRVPPEERERLDRLARAKAKRHREAVAKRKKRKRGGHK